MWRKCKQLISSLLETQDWEICSSSNNGTPSVVPRRRKTKWRSSSIFSRQEGDTIRLGDTEKGVLCMLSIEHAISCYTLIIFSSITAVKNSSQYMDLHTLFITNCPITWISLVPCYLWGNCWQSNWIFLKMPYTTTRKVRVNILAMSYFILPSSHFNQSEPFIWSFIRSIPWIPHFCKAFPS